MVIGKLLENEVNLHKGNATIINCRGIGTCGTYAVLVAGEVSVVNWRDKARRSLPPHDPTRNLRLACQTQVLGDVKVTKFNGFWGQGAEIVWNWGNRQVMSVEFKKVKEILQFKIQNS